MNCQAILMGPTLKYLPGLNICCLFQILAISWVTIGGLLFNLFLLTFPDRISWFCLALFNFIFLEWIRDWLGYFIRVFYLRLLFLNALCHLVADAFWKIFIQSHLTTCVFLSERNSFLSVICGSCLEMNWGDPSHSSDCSRRLDSGVLHYIWWFKFMNNAKR